MAQNVIRFYFFGTTWRNAKLYLSPVQVFVFFQAHGSCSWHRRGPQGVPFRVTACFKARAAEFVGVGVFGGGTNSALSMVSVPFLFCPRAFASLVGWGRVGDQGYGS